MVSEVAVTDKGPYGAEPGLIDFFADVWHAKFLIIFGMILGAVSAFLFLSMANPQYKAEMLVGPAERGTGPDIKALLPENSSFAVQYLVNSLGSQDSNDFIRFEHMLRGVTVASRLLDDDRVREGVRQAGLFGGVVSHDEPLNAAILARFLEKNVHVQPVGTSPLRRLVFSHPDKDFALFLLQKLYTQTDALIQEDIRQKTRSRAAYLQKAIKDTTHPDHRRALTSLLMEQEHIQMILNMEEPFAALVVEPPSAADKPSWPRKSVIWSVFLLMGAFFGFFVFQVARAVRKDM